MIKEGTELVDSRVGIAPRQGLPCGLELAFQAILLAVIERAEVGDLRADHADAYRRGHLHLDRDGARGCKAVAGAIAPFPEETSVFASFGKARSGTQGVDLVAEGPFLRNGSANSHSQERIPP